MCGPLEEGQDEQVLPDIGWVNVMPAADAVVDVGILGQSLQFSGNGYHDKVQYSPALVLGTSPRSQLTMLTPRKQNWGDEPFTSALQSWYWGHGTFGNYNILFFDMIDAAGVEKVGGYALLNGEVVGSTCTNGLQVRPVGTPYPPTLLAPNPTQLTINTTLNDGSILNATVTEIAVQIDVRLYTRWIGSIEGTVGGVTMSGSALWEQFKIKA